MGAFVVAFVLGTGLAGCISDLRTRRIPNTLTFGSALAALAIHAATAGPWGFVASLGGWLTGVAIFFPPYALGGMGAGDVKLLAALGAWLGPHETVWLALYTALAGGVLAVVVGLARGYLRQALRNIWLLLMHWRVFGPRPLREVSLEGSSGPRLAYGVAIFIGTVGTLWFR